jgi:CRP-like cAMP-binding protein
VGEHGGDPQWLRTLEPGSYFGEIGLLGRVPRTATVSASADCTLLRVGGDDFSASPSLLEGARTRLSITHPTSTVLLDLPDPVDGTA